MSHNYIVSAKRATAVTHAVLGNFTGDNDMNLIVAKINRFHIYLVTTDGLKSMQEVPVFGRIANIQLFRAKDETRDTLIVLTAKNHLAVLGWDVNTNALVTRAAGSVADRVGRPSEFGTVLTVHRSGTIGLRIYEGVLKVIQWWDDKDLKCFNVRMEDLNIVDLAFLDSEDDTLRLSYICQDLDGRHLKTVELSVLDKELKTRAKQNNIDNEAFMLIPMPPLAAGVVVVGAETLMYYKWDENLVMSMSPPTMVNTIQFTCFARIDKDGQRFLLGDDHGGLFMLILDIHEGPQSHQSHVRNLKLEYLGETSIPNCMVYLDNGVVFVGSRFGDSQLIRLTTQRNPDTNTFVQVLETFISLAPIRDMTVIEADGQTQLVTCSGYGKDGSLRVIRNGIGIEEYASVDLPGVKGIFALHVGSELDNYIVISFASESHILKIDGEELEDTTLMELTTEEATLYAGCIGASDCVLQITPSGMRLCGVERTAMWKSPKGHIDCASVNGHTGQIVVTSGSNLWYLRCDNGEFNEIASKELDHEVAAVDVSSFVLNTESNVVAVGLWETKNLILFVLPDLKEVVRDQLPVDVLPRSLLLAKLDRSYYLLVALGDGSLFYYTIDLESLQLRDLKKTSLGTQPPSLHRFDSNDQSHVFACSDRPAVIFASNNKLVFSNVNLKQLAQIGSLNSSKYKNCLMMSDGETLSIGTVDDIQKLHIRSVPLGESPRRIAYQKETGTIGIIVTREDTTDRRSISRMAVQSTSNTAETVRSSSSHHIDSSDNEVHSFVVLDHNTFEPLHSFEFPQNEHAISLISSRLGSDPNSPVYYIVGTAIVYSDETESKLGRLLVLQAGIGEERTKLRLITEKEVKGAPYSLAVLGPKLVITLNSSVRLFEWVEQKDKLELKLECSHFNQIAALFVKVKGDQILIGDLMRSMTILNYKNMESVFEEVARDYRSMWMTAVEFIDAETVVGGESSHNILTGEVDRNASEEKQKLRDAGAFYLGELVNVFQRGSLVGAHVDSTLRIDKPILFGTAEGTIGLIVQLSDEHYKFLSQVEQAIARETHNCMRVEHSSYRQFDSDHITTPCVGFVDGDLVESVLEWPRELSSKVLKDIVIPGGSSSSSPEDIMKIIEDLSRTH